MQKHCFNIRNLFYLYGIKVATITVICFLVTTLAYSQNFAGSKNNTNFFDFQKKPYYFGITLGYNNSTYRAFRSQQFLESDSISVVESVSGPGFNLGIVTNLKVGDYFDLRFLPTLSFAERNLEYDNAARSNNSLSLRTVESVFVEIPFHVRYKSAPFNDIRLFVIAGVKYAFDVASDSRTRQAETLVKISPSDFAIEYGAGVQIFFPYFIFSPEIKISQGIGNTLLFNDKLEESSVLEKILSRTFTLSFHFEG